MDMPGYRRTVRAWRHRLASSRRPAARKCSGKSPAALKPTVTSYIGHLSSGAGDVLMVTRLDRLARSTRDLLNILAAISGKKAGFKSLSDTWADTTTAHGRLMFTVLGGLAEFERELIRARTGEGRKLAKARGVKMGRKPKLTPHQQREALQRRDAGEPTREIARTYNVSHSTISRLPRHG